MPHYVFAWWGHARARALISVKTRHGSIDLWGPRSELSGPRAETIEEAPPAACKKERVQKRSGEAEAGDWGERADPSISRVLGGRRPRFSPCTPYRLGAGLVPSGALPESASPLPDSPDIDMYKARIRVIADAASIHRQGGVAERGCGDSFDGDVDGHALHMQASARHPSAGVG
jgi:hypothetical protein